MTPVRKQVVAASEAQSGAEHRNDLVVVFQRAETLPHDLPVDTDLVTAAEALFEEMDRHEESR